MRYIQSLDDVLLMRRTTPARRTKRPDTSVLDSARYRSCSRMLWKLATRASAVSGVSLDEMRAEADMLFVVACRTFSETRGVKFSTFLYSVVSNGLIDFGKSEAKHDNRTLRETARISTEDGTALDVVDTAVDERAERAFRFNELYNSLSHDERLIVDLALIGAGHTMETLRTIAIERFGFMPKRAECACARVKSLVREFVR